MVDDADTIGDLRLVEVVGREEDRRPVGGARPEQVLPQRVPAHRVEA
jgi:hypothetical protein